MWVSVSVCVCGWDNHMSSLLWEAVRNWVSSFITLSSLTTGNRKIVRLINKHRITGTQCAKWQREFSKEQWQENFCFVLLEICWCTVFVEKLIKKQWQWRVTGLTVTKLRKQSSSRWFLCTYWTYCKWWVFLLKEKLAWQQQCCMWAVIDFNAAPMRKKNWGGGDHIDAAPLRNRNWKCGIDHVNLDTALLGRRNSLRCWERGDDTSLNFVLPVSRQWRWGRVSVLNMAT